MPYAYAKDVRLYYELHGETGSPLLLIAGYGATLAGWWRPTVDCLAERHRVILFDNRGAGNSDKPDQAYTMTQFADDTAAVLDAAGFESAHVLGASMGGMIAQNFALRYANRVRGLILCCTVATSPQNPSVIGPAEEVLATLTAPRTDNPAQDMRNLWPILYAPHFIEENRVLLEELLKQKIAYPQAPQYALEHQMHAVNQTHDALDRLGEFKQPTLVLTGAEDVLIPPWNSRLLVERIPNALLIEYAGAGHGFLEETGMQAVDDILRFLAKIDG
jgi:3-oxoadipate enol-lactonase